MDLNLYMDVAINTARNAGILILNQASEPVVVDSAIGRDMKLRLDREAESVIIYDLQNSTSFPILTEESGSVGKVSNDDQPYWVVDPLDGSLNFQHGIPFYCVSIALWRQNQPLLGVIYDLPHQNLYSGICNKGAFCDGKLIQVSNVIEQNQAVLATGFPTKRSFKNDSLSDFVSQVQKFKKVRLLGAGALSLAYCAAGKVDAYMEEDIFMWDVAAGIALVKAAGGYVNYQSSPNVEWGMTVRCASSSSLFE